MYTIKYSDEAKADLALLRRSVPAAFKKATKFIAELMEHPYTGTGHPHPLTGDRAGEWSRSITKKHRLVYQVKDSEVLVLVLAAYGHYDDK